MATRTVFLAITVKVNDEAKAYSIAQGAAEHLLETFNDDGSLKSVQTYGFAHAVIRADTLGDLIDGADFGQDQKDYDAMRAKEGDPNGASSACELRREARTWRKAVRAGMALQRRLPRIKPAANQTA